MNASDFGLWFLATVPILSILILIMKFRWGGSKAGPAGWLIAVVVAFLFFGADLKVLTVGSLKGLWSTIFILYIIWGALALYNAVDCVKGFDVITVKVTKWTGGDRLLQILTIGWAFPSFIQGVCGFGAPVAISAPLLVGLGFNPILSATVVLIGHAWSITFGSLGSSYGAMISIVEVDAAGLAFWSSTFLAICCIISGFIVAYLYSGREGLIKATPSIIVLGTFMAGSFWLTVNYLTPYLGSLVGGLVGLLVGSWVLIRMPWNQKSLDSAKPSKEEWQSKMSFSEAAAAYLILLVVVFIMYLTPFNEFLRWAYVGLSFPQTITKHGFINYAVEQYAPINFLTTPGTLIVVSVFIAILFYKSKGIWKNNYTQRMLSLTSKQAVPVTITIMTMCMMSLVMMETGMTTRLAQGVASFSGAVYPIFAPLVGALGAFMTGSNTSSNILFTAFQKDVAELLQINYIIVLTLQTVGGSLGCMFSPMKVALGTGVTGIAGSEGIIIKRTLFSGIFLCLLTGFAGLLLIYVL